MIYFLRAEQDSDFVKAGWIKIGTSIRLSARLKQIAVEISHKPTVLAVLDGAFAEEHALHARFSYARAKGEWFLASPDLLQLIEIEGRPWNGIDECQLGTVNLNPDVVKLARIVAAYDGRTMTDLLSDILDPILAKLEDEAIARRTKPRKGKP